MDEKEIKIKRELKAIPHKILVNAFTSEVDQLRTPTLRFFFTSLELITVISRARAIAIDYTISTKFPDFLSTLANDLDNASVNARTLANDLANAGVNARTLADDNSSTITLAGDVASASSLASYFAHASTIAGDVASVLYRASSLTWQATKTGFIVRDVMSDLANVSDYALAPAIDLARMLSEYLDQEANITSIRLATNDSSLSGGPTPDYLGHTITPYLKAITQLQQAIDRLTGQEGGEVRIAAMTRGSLDISFDGAARAIEVILDTIVPWRRKHAQTIAKLNEQEKQIAVKKLQGETEAANETAAAKAREEVRKLQLENEKLQVELHEKRIDLALKVIDKLNPELPQAQKIGYVIQLLEPIKVITESPLQLVDSSGEGSEGE